MTPRSYPFCCLLGLSLAQVSLAQDTVLDTLQIKLSKTTAPIWQDQNRGHNFSYTLIGPKWSVDDHTIGGFADPKIPIIDVSLGRTGAQTTFGGSGEFGISVRPWYDGGSMNLLYNGEIGVHCSNASPRRGDPVTIRADFKGMPGSSFQTTSPTFGMGAKVVFKASGHADYEAALLGDSLGSGSLFPKFSVGGEYELTSLISGNHDGGIVDFTEKDLEAIAKGLTLAGAKVTASSNSAGAPAFAANGLLASLRKPSAANAFVVCLYIPDISTRTASVNSDNSLSARSYGKIIDIGTSDYPLLQTFGGPEGRAAVKVLTGDYTVGTSHASASVSWEIAKLLADFNLRLVENLTLRPVPSITLNVYVDTGSTSTLLATGTGSVNFNYPTQGNIRIVPTVSVNFQVENKLDFGVGGDVSMLPLGAGIHVYAGVKHLSKSWDYGWSAPTLSWSGDASACKITNETTSFSTDPQTLRALNLNPADSPLPPYLLDSGSIATRYIPVPDAPANPTAPSRTVTLVPAPNSKLYVTSSGYQVTATLNLPNSPAVNLAVTSQDSPGGGSITLSLPNTLNLNSLPDGANPSVTLAVQAKTDAGILHSARYDLPLYPVRQTAVTDPNLYTDQTLSKTVNRCPEDGQSHTFWLKVQSGAYEDSQIQIDGTSPLSLIRPDSTSQSGVFGFTVPAALASDLSGKPHTIQLVSPNLIPDALGHRSVLVSSAISLFFPAPTPGVKGVWVTGIPESEKPLLSDGRDQWITLEGTGFSANTTVRATVPNGQMEQHLFTLSKLFKKPPITTQQPMTVTYLNPESIKVLVPAEMILASQELGVWSLPLSVANPSFSVPADSSNPASVAGGTTTTQISIEPPMPRIAEVVSPALEPGKPAVVTVIAGDIVRSRISSQVLTQVVYHGSALPAAAVEFDPSVAPTWVRFHLTGAQLQPGASDFVLMNGNVGSNEAWVPVVHKDAVLESATALLDPTNPNQVILTVKGKNLYVDSDLEAEGMTVVTRPAGRLSKIHLPQITIAKDSALLTVSPTSAQFGFDAKKFPSKKEIVIMVLNPHSGESNPIKVSWP